MSVTLLVSKSFKSNDVIQYPWSNEYVHTKEELEEYLELVDEIVPKLAKIEMILRENNKYLITFCLKNSNLMDMTFRYDDKLVRDQIYDALSDYNISDKIVFGSK